MHLSVCCLRGIPASFASILIDEKPTTIRSVPFGRPARRKVMIRVRRRMGRTIKGTLACILVDAGTSQDVKLRVCTT